jgi:hypothetical protein
MKQLLLILLVAFVSCTSRQGAEQQENKSEKGNTVATVPLNGGAKWKADEVTKKNVAAMVQIITDSAYADAAKRKDLYTNLKAKIDTLVKECSMKGAEHDALHVWLEKVLSDLKELKRDNNEYNEAYTALKKDVESFYQSFE